MGILISVDGLDGSGKTTLVESTRRLLEKSGFNVLATAEPADEVFGGRLLRDILRHKLPAPSPAALGMLFAANRVEHYRLQIAPRLEHADSAVISDRYIMSNLVYQRSEGLDFHDILGMNRFVPLPDLAVFLDTDPTECARRVANRVGGNAELFESDYESRRSAFQDARTFLASEGCKVLTIDGSATLAQQTSAIRDAASHPRIHVEFPLAER